MSLIYKSLHMIIDMLPLLIEGAFVTLKVSLCIAAVGMLLGFFLGIMSCKKLRIRFIGWLVDTYILLFRGTPVFVQLIATYYALPHVLDIDPSPFVAGVIALGCNSAAYVAEIVRGGINVVPEGQWDACYVLGYNKVQALRIILPQFLRNNIPPLVNEVLAQVKESSILSAIGLIELTKMGININARLLDPMTVYCVIGCIYLILISFLAHIGFIIEKRINGEN